MSKEAGLRARLFSLSNVMRRPGVILAIAGAVTALGPGAAPAAADVSWVCKPGQADNICLEDLTTTVYGPGGRSRVEKAPIPANPPVDCFYVYPTVSNQPGPNATKAIDPEIEGIVRWQAARFSQQCRVFAPVYRQNTVPALLARGAYTTPASRQLAYADVLEAWRDYMRNHNRGRGVVLIGHSQGSFHLRRLIRTEIDPKPALRRQLVSALLLGGNVLVKRGRQTGGDFQNVPACRAEGQPGCVIAYSLFNETPPDSPRFGKPPPEPDPVTGNPGGPGYEVVCTNPASLGANRQVEIEPLIPGKPFPPGFIALSITQAYGGPPPSAPTPWLRPADRYTGRCETSNGANVLMVRSIGDARRLNPSPDDSWGLHIVDVNGLFGDLQRAVTGQTRTFLRKLGRPRLGLRLRYRRGRDARGRRCARPPIRVALTGRDRRLVRRADFRANRRLVKRDRRFPFTVRIRSSRLRAGRVVRIGLRARLSDGRSRRIFRRVRVCR